MSHIRFCTLVLRVKYSIIIFLIFALAIMQTGCNKSLPLAPVTGTVTYKGEPLTEGIITFVVAGARDGSAKIVNGQIVEGSTFKTGDGIAIGTAQLAIVAEKTVGQKEIPGEEDPAVKIKVDIRKSVIPAKYNRIETSGLTSEIKKGKNELKLELTD